jgi:signal transduction histidine kinase
MRKENGFIQKTPLNIAIVGGGRTCKFFLESINLENLLSFKVRIIGVCDINPQAEGFRLAQEMGIYTTTDFRDLFKLKHLDGIIELTNDREVLLELIQLRPRQIGILEHNIGHLLRKLFQFDQQLQSARQQVHVEKTICDFLIQHHGQRILVLNKDFTIAEANDAYLKAINKKRAEVIGLHCYSVVHGFEAPCDTLLSGLMCPVLETIRTGESAHVVQPDPMSGSPKTYNNIVTYPVKDLDGNIVRIVEIWQDITDQISNRLEEREKELKSNLNKLIQEDRLISLGKLVASCVHEINNPIQGLLTFSHLMKHLLEQDRPGPDDIQKMRKFAGLMANELERCGNIISGLLSFSRESPMAYRNINLNEVISSVVELTRHKMELLDISLRIDLCPEFLCINGDTNRLQQCFLNLVFNAIEAMPLGGHLEIVSSLMADKQEACVKIGDTGPGIPEAHLNHIFDPFFTTKEMGEGTGMGLSIVYGVLKQHGGEIKVETEIGKGTAFILCFPLVTVKPRSGSGHEK